MTERIIFGLIILIGIIAAWVGVLLANSRIRSANRAYQKTALLYATMPDGWSSWFMNGFSGVAIGTHLLRATLVFTAWAIAGLFLVVLGIQLFYRV